MKTQSKLILSYLIRNQHSYCFRIKVPKNIQCKVGKTELRYSLKTGNVGKCAEKVLKEYQLMQANMYNLVPAISELIDNYINLEKEVQKKTNEISKHFCKQCQTTCCKEEICRESFNSAFLSLLVESQDVQYDQHYGWLGLNGCKLDFGRPFVCYQYFCDRIEKKEIYKTSNIKLLVKEFLSVGDKAHKGNHLICVEDLQLISDAKIEKMNLHIKELKDKLTNNYFYMQEYTV